MKSYFSTLLFTLQLSYWRGSGVWWKQMHVKRFKVLSHQATCHSDMYGPWQNHIHVYMSHKVTCRVPNPFSQGLQSQGRPAIGLFSACHMRDVHATFCRCDMSHEFKLIWIHATSGSIKLHKNIHATGGNWSPCETGPMTAFTELLILCDGAISHNRPQITSDRIIHEKSYNSWKVAQCEQSTQ